MNCPTQPFYPQELFHPRLWWLYSMNCWILFAVEILALRNILFADFNLQNCVLRFFSAFSIALIYIRNQKFWGKPCKGFHQENLICCLLNTVVKVRKLMLSSKTKFDSLIKNNTAISEAVFFNLASSRFVGIVVFKSAI